MKKRWVILTLLPIAFYLAGSCRAGEFKKLGQTSMKWLSIPIGAKSMSLGNASYCDAASASNGFWNPAGVGFIKSPQIFLSHVPWIADITQEAAALAVPLGKLGTVSANIRVVDFGKQQGTRLASNDRGWEYTEEFSPTAYQIGLVFSQRITDRFSYGLNLSYAQEKLGTVRYAPVIGGDSNNPLSQKTSMSLFAMDFGVLYYTGFRDLRLGMTLKNFSEEKGYGNVGNSIPMELHFGMAMNLVSLVFPENTKHQLTFSWDLSHPRDYSERLHFGMEYVYSSLVALRAGYKTNYDEEDLSFGAGVMPGIGFGSMKVGLDYAYVPFGVFGAIQSFSFNINF